MLSYSVTLLFGMVALVGIGWRLYGFVGQMFCYFFENKQQEREEGCIDAAFESCYCNDMILPCFKLKLLLVTVVAGWFSGSASKKVEGDQIKGINF